MSRHPYTYAADFLREKCRGGEEVVPGIRACPLSRSDAATIREAIAKEIGMEDSELAEILSNAYQKEHGL